jgi:hypothetical protein
MLDSLDYTVSKKLADRHLYPFAQQIYADIFKSFSHFPVDLHNLGISGKGKTVTFLAYVIFSCFERSYPSFQLLYQNIVKKMQSEVKTILVQDINVETLLGCILYYYHPSMVKNALARNDIITMLSEHEKYEYELKKDTILLHIL